MVLIIWDKLFGTFQKEENSEPVRYGLTTNLKQPYHPLKTVFHEWGNIINDIIRAKSVKAKFMHLFGPPGWSADGSTKTSRQLRAEMYKKS